MRGIFKRLTGRDAAPLSPALAALARPAVVLRAGGAARHGSRRASWWGGNFIAEAPRPALVPLAQIRAADLLVWADPARLATGDITGALEIAALAEPGPGPADVPPEQVCRIEGAIACLPLTLARAQALLPDPADAPAGTILPRPPRAPEDDEPVTLGGWPQWIGGSQLPPGARFVLEIRSSEKGRLKLGDAGSLYLFRAGEGWIWRADSY